MADSGYKMDIASTASATATGGNAGGGTGDFLVNQKSKGVSNLVWFAVAAFAAFILWRTNKRKR